MLDAGEPVQQGPAAEAPVRGDAPARNLAAECKQFQLLRLDAEEFRRLL